MPLVLGDAGCEYDIKKIGGNDEVRTRLSAMGICSRRESHTGFL